MINMEPIGGVFLSAGTVLNVAPQFHHAGPDMIRLTIEHVLDVTADYVLIRGMEKVMNCGPWRTRDLPVLIKGLKQSLT